MGSNKVGQGDVRRYEAEVVETYNEGLVDVLCPSLSDSPIKGIGPSAVPVGVISTPNVGDQVVIEERAGDDMSESVTYLGWSSVMHEATTYQQEGMTALVSPSRDLCVVLDDGFEDEQDTPPAVRVGRPTASEAAVLGDLYKAWMTALLQEIEGLLTGANGMEAMVAGLETFLAVDQPWQLSVDGVVSGFNGAHATLGTARATALTALVGAGGSGALLAAHRAVLTSMQGKLQAKRDEIAEHLSTLVKIAGE